MKGVHGVRQCEVLPAAAVDGNSEGACCTKRPLAMLATAADYSS